VENPHHPLLPVIQASLAYLQKDVQQAREKLESLLIEHPDSLWILMYLGEFCSGIGMYRREVTAEERALARECFAKILTLHSGNLRIARGLAACGSDKVMPAEQNPDPSGVTVRIPSRQQTFDILNHADTWSEIKHLAGHENLVTAVAITRDGKWAASGDCEGKLILWNVSAGQLTAALSGHRKHISDVAFSDDGTILLSASWDHTARIWEVPSGKCLWTLEGHQDKLSSVALTPDGKTALTGSWDGTARVWDIPAQKHLVTFVHADKAWITDVSISPDGKLALICDGDECMYLWDIATQTTLAQMGGVTGTFNQDATLAISSRSHYVETWRIPSGDVQQTFSGGRKEFCLGVAGNSTMLLSRSEEDMLSIWEIKTGQRLTTLPMEDSICAGITQEGRYVISGHDSTVYVWENIMERPFPVSRRAFYLPPDLRNHAPIPKLIYETAYKAEMASWNGQFLQSAQLYKSIQKIPSYELSEELLDGIARNAEKAGIAPTGIYRVYVRCETAVHKAATSIAMAGNGEIVLLASYDDPVAAWNLRSGYPLHLFSSHRRCLSGVAVTTDGSMAATASWDGTVNLRYLDSPDKYEVVGTHKTWVTGIAMAPHAQYVLYGTRGGEVFLYHPVSRTATQLIPACSCDSRFCAHSIIHATIADQGKCGAVVAQDGTISIWNLEDRQPVGRFRPHGRLAIALALSPDGKKAISADSSGTLLYWDTATGQVIAQFGQPQAAPEVAAEFTQPEVIRGLKMIQDNLFVSLSSYSVLRLWNIPSRESIYQQALHNNPLAAWAMTPNRRFLVSAAENKELKLWELEWQWDFGCTPKPEPKSET
jgi:WD40 repeat protein